MHLHTPSRIEGSAGGSECLNPKCAIRSYQRGTLRLFRPWEERLVRLSPLSENSSPLYTWASPTFLCQLSSHMGLGPSRGIPVYQSSLGFITTTSLWWAQTETMSVSMGRWLVVVYGWWINEPTFRDTQRGFWVNIEWKCKQTITY